MPIWVRKRSGEGSSGQVSRHIVFHCLNTVVSLCSGPLVEKTQRLRIQFRSADDARKATCSRDSISVATWFDEVRAGQYRTSLQQRNSQKS